MLALMWLLGPRTNTHAQVCITGAMRNTMFNGQLDGLIDMDTLTSSGTYGLGPLAGLRGEVLLLDGLPFASRITPEGKLVVEQDANAQAPFFAHQRIASWKNVQLPDSITDLQALDGFMSKTFAQSNEPFMFTLTGTVDSAQVHVVDVPPGTKVRSPEDAHAGMERFRVADRACDMVGFFSLRHKSVLTHHDTNLHIHLITTDRQLMGHLDNLYIDPHTMRLAIPQHL